MKVVCQATVTCSECLQSEPDQQALKLAQYIDKNTSDPEVRALFSELATLAPAQKVAKVRDAASAAGIDACPYVDWLDGWAKMPPTPER
ncbi:MAG: hypothetical protein ACRBN8_40235 [Nannocystales bacterium]